MGPGSGSELFLKGYAIRSRNPPETGTVLSVRTRLPSVCTGVFGSWIQFWRRWRRLLGPSVRAGAGTVIPSASAGSSEGLMARSHATKIIIMKRPVGLEL